MHRYQKTLTEQVRNIDLILIPKGSTRMALAAGTYVRSDALGLTSDGLEEGDEVLTEDDVYYEVEATREITLGDSFSHREVDLTKLPFKNLIGKTYTESTVADAKYRTKVYLETYLRTTYLPSFIVTFGLPDYPITQILKQRGMDLIFAVLDPEPSKALVDSDHYPIGYDERVPIETFCIDKDNIDGAKLQWQAASELRYVTGNYPEGSLRNLDEMRPNRKDLGSTVLYSQRFTLAYTRDKT